MEFENKKEVPSKLDKQLKKCFNRRNNKKYLTTGMF